MPDPIVKRGPVRSVIGVEASTLQVTLLLNKDTTIANMPAATFVRQGGFDGTWVHVARHYSRAWSEPSCGSLRVFTGRVAEVELTGTECRLTLKSALELLDVQLPRNVYEAQCVWTVYGEGCGLVSANWTSNASVTSGNTTTINCNLTQPAGYFNLGSMTITSGPNVGTIRTIRRHDFGQLIPILPLPNVPGAGDTFEIKPTCDRTRAMCNARFDNEANIRIYPYIPAPEALL